MIGDRAEPLTAIYPADAHADLVAALSGNDFSLQTLTSRLVKAGKLRVFPVSKKEVRLFCNLNAPADLD
jgi:molybdopterin-guanine dinucleotide biosynthesis protein A